MMFLDLKRLKYFVDVCDVGSLTGAASVAHVTQPVLSYHITELERQIGDKLFYRHAHGVSLSDTGVALLAHARKVLNAVAEAERAMQERSLRPTGPVTVGLLSSIAPSLGPTLLAEARARFPNVALTLVEGDNFALRNSLQSGRLDFAITLQNHEDTSGIVLMVEDMFLFGIPSVVKADRPTVTLREALQAPLVLPPATHSVRRLVENAAKASGLGLKLAWEVEGLALLKAVAATGHVAGILGFAAIRRECESGVFVASRIGKPTLQRDIVLEISAIRPVTRAASEVRDIATRLVEDLATAARWRRPQANP